MRALTAICVGGATWTFVATARVLGGMHFITDVVGGAAVGTSVGVIVPSLHGSPVCIVPVAGSSFLIFSDRLGFSAATARNLLVLRSRRA